MTATLISLLSILTGIIGANILAITFKKYSFGIVGNTIAVSSLLNYLEGWVSTLLK